jgi:hypothetical protein
MAFADEIDKEIKSLEQSLEADPRMQKIRELRRIRALYDRTQGAMIFGHIPAKPMTFAGGGDALPLKTAVNTSSVSDEALFQGWMTHHLTRKPGGRRPSPERLRAVSAAKKFVRGKIGPVPISAIFEHLCTLGITIKGSDPKNNLSAMLSNTEGFNSHGRSGWTLSEPTVPVIPDNILETP